MNIKKTLLWAKEEALKVIPAIIYFCIMFNLVHFVANLMLKSGARIYHSYFEVTIFALIVGKVILIVNNLPFLNVFPRKPLIYNIVWKFSIYMIFIFIVWACDAFTHLWHRFGFDLGRLKLVDVIDTQIFLAAYLSMGIVFLGYVVFSEFTRALGKDTMIKMLFGR